MIRRRPKLLVVTARDAARPAPPKPRTGLRFGKWRPNRGGGLIGFATVRWPAAGVVFTDCGVFRTAAGEHFVALPATPIIDGAGRHHTVDGRHQYHRRTDWLDRERGARFSGIVVELLRRRYPDALLDDDDEGAP